MGEQNKELRQLFDNRLRESHEISRNQFSETTRVIQNISRDSAKTIAEVTEKLTKLDETNRQVVNFSSQLQKLQDILKNPKQRGVLGEYFLEETLKNVLPPNSYEMQYKFKNGEIVDAVVFVKDLIVPIDSKFSLENYEKLIDAKDQATRDNWEKLFKQDLKNRIDETSKYIRPAEKTMDFAFMFIPSEAIYYDLLVGRVGVDTRNLIEYAFVNKKVIIVSPTSFLAYLQTVLQGLRAMQIEESAKSIRENVEKLGKHLTAYEVFMDKLGNTLGTTVNHYNSAVGEFKKVDKDVARITESSTTSNLDLIEAPHHD
ncbi:DNA recombination protein RmuC [Candidatus Falkowbacteria bacterium CG10_big_fil_rev_8_21_14_0_10_37_14]|uniref:DNA recombination protein RmuC n=1 Tax=Candidatus Falkowbacteria bacterium CG10_big_fil_rev_8_21_14_0_10_37_14 TaxID=1974561 RepID=A0A2M6WUL7_9BACT|nr:DNA recombination protein RmuC [Candidatus Falkowbacteria bacterium]PIT96470.1 MAG: DNA recombination protein RmuC [Candidatus Falkowbacteria bacterium CG10_big_fil_rev_8_21_14_0_10_37_14]